METLNAIRDSVWGLPTVLLLVGTGVFLTIRLGFLQFRYFYFGIRIMLGLADKEEGSRHSMPGDVSHFRAFSTAMSATVGTGNIVGVAGAILVGGPGALFWMWVTAFFGMATKYAEAVLAVKFRENTNYGYAGGPMFYLEKGLKLRWLGIMFAILTMIAAFGIGNMVQINSAAAALKNTSLAIPRVATSAVVAVLVGLVILGSVNRIGKTTAILVPFMAVLYLGGTLAILALNGRELDDVFALILDSAIAPLPALSGGFAAFFTLTVSAGVRRGLFSNEAGLGSAPIAAASARTDYPVKQGLVSMLAPFFDTLVVCTLTGLVVILGLKTAGSEIIGGLVSGRPELAAAMADMGTYPDIFSGLAGAFGVHAEALQNLLASAVFGHVLGPVGRDLVGISLFFFAVSTIIGWYFYSDRALVYLKLGRAIPYYRLVYVILIFVGGLTNVGFVWSFSEIANGAMALPNLIALLLLSGTVHKETRSFFRKFPHRHDLSVQIYTAFLRLLPKNTLSKFMGLLAGLKLPRFLMIPVIIAFAKVFRINVQEAELELRDYSSINAFFTRALKNGVRVIEQDEHVIVSPVDGTVLQSGSVDKGTIMQSKGLESTVEALLSSAEYYPRFLGGSGITIYLSPRDYHRIHSPVAGRIVGYSYRPGKLFPVNTIAVQTIDRLFSRNERLITWIDTGRGLVALVKIGATSVGKIRVTYDTITTNRWWRSGVEHTYRNPIEIAKGAEIGRFEMGSTVILLFERDMMEFLEFEDKQKLMYGQPIGLFQRNRNKEPVSGGGKSK